MSFTLNPQQAEALSIYLGMLFTYKRPLSLLSKLTWCLVWLVSSKKFRLKHDLEATLKLLIEHGYEFNRGKDKYSTSDQSVTLPNDLVKTLSIMLDGLVPTIRQNIQRADYLFLEGLPDAPAYLATLEDLLERFKLHLKG